MAFLEDVVREMRSAVADPGYLDGLPADRPGRRPSLRSAVERTADRGALLVEFKRVSPGRADPVLPSRSIDEFVRATEGPAVAGYSCLATLPRFDGSPRDVADLARATDRPILFKDFVLEVRQLDAAVRAGASAVLLIARLETQGLLRVPLATLSREAHDRGLEVLLEWHARSELSGTDGVAADMFGVNVRDLDTLAIDRPTAEATLNEARDAGRRPLLGLSGIESARDAERFWRHGVDGVLVGTAVVRAPDPRAFLASLHRPSSGGGR